MNLNSTQGNGNLPEFICSVATCGTLIDYKDCTGFNEFWVMFAARDLAQVTIVFGLSAEAHTNTQNYSMRDRD